MDGRRAIAKREIRPKRIGFWSQIGESGCAVMAGRGYATQQPLTITQGDVDLGQGDVIRIEITILIVIIKSCDDYATS